MFIINDVLRLNSAILLADRAHYSQVDKSGQPYILHPMRIMLSCNTISERIVAILHDVLEDTSVTLLEIEQTVKLTAEEKDALVLLTKSPSMTYEEYVTRIKSSGSEIALKVKKLDVLDNINLDRLSKLDQSTRDRLISKYMKAISVLTN